MQISRKAGKKPVTNGIRSKKKKEEIKEKITKNKKLGKKVAKEKNGSFKNMNSIAN